MRTSLLQRTSLAVVAALSLGGAFAQNAYLANLSMSRYIKANTDYQISVWCRNTSSVAYTSCSVYWKLDNGTTHTMTTVNIGGGGIVTNNYLPVTHPDEMNATQGSHVLRVWINTTTDSDHSNDTIVVPFVALNTWADKVVLLEARTETWCPNCPESNDETNELNQNPDFAVTKFHLSDALDQCVECVDYYNDYNINYTPAGMIEMGEYGSYEINSQWPGWGATMEAKALGVSPVALTMTSSVNWTTRQMSVTINANFTYVVSGGEFKFNVYVVENLVPGPQENAAPNYIHNRVMRGMLGGASATSGVIPGAPVPGTEYSHTYTWTIPAGYKIGDLKLVGLVEHDLGAQGRYTLNAVKSSASPVGISEEALWNDHMVVYPNPFTNELQITVAGLTGAARAEVVSLDGRLVAADNLNLNGTAPSRIDLDGAQMPAGAYVLRVITEQGTFERHVMKMN